MAGSRPGEGIADTARGAPRPSAWRPTAGRRAARGAAHRGSRTRIGAGGLPAADCRGQRGRVESAAAQAPDDANASASGTTRQSARFASVSPRNWRAAEVAELADASDSKSDARKGMRVRVPPSAISAMPKPSASHPADGSFPAAPRRTRTTPAGALRLPAIRVRFRLHTSARPVSTGPLHTSVGYWRTALAVSTIGVVATLTGRLRRCIGSDTRAWLCPRTPERRRLVRVARGFEGSPPPCFS